MSALTLLNSSLSRDTSPCRDTPPLPFDRPLKCRSGPATMVRGSLLVDDQERHWARAPGGGVSHSRHVARGWSPAMSSTTSESTTSNTSFPPTPYGLTTTVGLRASSPACTWLSLPDVSPIPSPVQVERTIKALKDVRLVKTPSGWYYPLSEVNRTGTLVTDLRSPSPSESLTPLDPSSGFSSPLVHTGPQLEAPTPIHRPGYRYNQLSQSSVYGLGLYPSVASSFSLRCGVGSRSPSFVEPTTVTDGWSSPAPKSAMPAPCWPSMVLPVLNGPKTLTPLASGSVIHPLSKFDALKQPTPWVSRRAEFADPDDEVYTPPRISKSLSDTPPPRYSPIGSPRPSTTSIVHAGEAFVPMHILGGGSESRVVSVRHSRTGKVFALKVVQKGVAAAHGYKRAHFLGEKIAMGAIGMLAAVHGQFKSHLVGLLMSWEDVSDDKVYFLMPQHGPDLSTILWNQDQFPISRADRILWCQELVCALTELRRLGIMHCDLKPANVLVDANGRAVLTDFGTAQSVPYYEYEDRRLYVRSGTCSYLAPEVAAVDMSVKGFTTNADVFSMGVVFCDIMGFILDGLSLFHALDMDSVRQKHAQRLPFNPAVFESLGSELMYQLLTVMLEVDPEKRITVRELDDRFVRSVEWAGVRGGTTSHEWKPNLAPAEPEDSLRCHYYLAFDGCKRVQPQCGAMLDPKEFEHRVPGIFT